MILSESLYKVHRPIHNDKMVAIPGIRVCIAGEGAFILSCNYDKRCIDIYPILSGHSLTTVGEPKSYGRNDTPPAWVNEMRDPDGYVDWTIIDFGWLNVCQDSQQ